MASIPAVEIDLFISDAQDQHLVFDAFNFPVDTGLDFFTNNINASNVIKRSSQVKNINKAVSANSIGIGSEFWFDRIHVIPDTINFENYTVGESADLDIYNANENNISISEPTIPDPVIFSGATFPLAIEALTSHRISVSFDDSQARSVDEDITFSDGVTQDIVNILGVISSVVFPFAPEAPLRISLNYYTDIITSRTQEEQRLTVRANPVIQMNQAFKTSLQESQVLENLLFRSHGRSWVFPLWYSQTLLSEDAGTGALTLMLDTTKLIISDAEFFDLLLWDSYDRFEVVSVDEVNDDSITLRRGLISDWSINSIVFPLVNAYSYGQVERVSRTDSNLLDSWEINFSINLPVMPEDLDDSSFEILSGDNVIFPEIIYYESNFINKTVFADVIDFETTGSGRIVGRKNLDSLNQSYNINFIALGYDQIITLFQIANYFKGRWRQVYISTKQRDLIVKEDSVDNVTIRTFATEYARNILIDTAGQKNFIEIVYNNGDVESKEIVSVTANADYDEVELDTALTTAITVANIDRISFYVLVRGNSDEAIITLNTLNSAQLEMSFIQIKRND